MARMPKGGGIELGSWPMSLMCRGSIAIVFALGALALSGSYLLTDEPPRKCEEPAERSKAQLPLPYQPNASNEAVYLRVGEVRYAIPKNYFRYPPIGCDSNEGGFLLRALLPTFEGWTEQNRKAISGSANSLNMGMNILLNDSTKAGYMNRIFENHAPGVDVNGTYLQWDGLRYAKDKDGSDVFFLRNETEVIFVMTCNTKKQVPYPGCSQFHQYRGDLLKATFRRTNLNDWKHIHEGTVALLDRFVKAASTGR